MTFSLVSPTLTTAKYIIFRHSVSSFSLQKDMYAHYPQFLLVTFSIYAVGFVLISTLLYCIARDSRLRRSVHDKVTILELVSMLFWICTVAPINLITYFNGGLEGDLGHTLCQANGSFVVFAAGTAMLAQMLMALDRFFVIVMAKVINVKILVAVAITATVWNISIISLQMGRFASQEGGLWCFFKMTYDVSEGEGLRDIWPSIAMIVYFAIFSGIQNSVYFFILAKARRVFKVTESKRKHNQKSSIRSPTSEVVNNTSNIQDIPNSHERLQKLILRRCMAIMGVFQVCYGPCFILLVYRLISNQKIDPLLEIVTTAASVCNVALAPLLYFYLRTDYYTAFKEHILGFKEREPDSVNPRTIASSSSYKVKQSISTNVSST